jgi:hypothetical protein
MTLLQVEHVESKQMAAAKIIPVSSDDEIEDFLVEVSRTLVTPHALWWTFSRSARTRALSALSLHSFGRRSFGFAVFLSAAHAKVLMELCSGGALDDIILGDPQACSSHTKQNLKLVSRKSRSSPFAANFLT